MSEKEVKLTKEGYAKLEEELHYLKGHRRSEVADKIKEALSFGDISENSEYDDAKNEQAQMEIRIQEIDRKLKNAVIIEEAVPGSGVVTIGSKVRVLDVKYKEEEVYYIVGSTEADPFANKISDESPVGKVLIGQIAGKVVEVEIPAGMVKYEIVEISK